MWSSCLRSSDTCGTCGTGGTGEGTGASEGSCISPAPSAQAPALFRSSAATPPSPLHLPGPAPNLPQVRLLLFGSRLPRRPELQRRHPGLKGWPVACLRGGCTTPAGGCRRQGARASVGAASGALARRMQSVGHLDTLPPRSLPPLMHEARTSRSSRQLQASSYRPCKLYKS